MITIQPGVFKTSVNKAASFLNRCVEREVAAPERFSNLVRISEDLPADVFNTISSLVPSIDKFAKENNLIVDFAKGKKDTRVHMTVNQNNIQVFSTSPAGANIDPLGMQPTYQITGSIDELVNTDLLLNPPKTMDSFARAVFKKISEASHSSINRGQKVHIEEVPVITPLEKHTFIG